MLRWLAVISSKVRSSLRIPAQHNNKQREGNMNTIAITTGENVVTYSELEVKRYVERAEQLSDIKYKVRDFFSELEWSDGEATITRSDVNKLLKSIQCDLIRAEYKATVTITAYVTGYSADDEDDAENCIADDINVSIGSDGSIDVDSVEVSDVEEE
jgi:type IV secretory pathway VirJ component